MANIETFYKGLMASEDVKSYLGSTKFKSGDAYAIVNDGALVTLGGLAKNDAYGANALDYNVYESTAPAADTDPIVIIDLAEVSQGIIAGNNYKIGIKAVGLKCAAGYTARYRVPVAHDRFWVSGDCFNADPTVGEFGIATAGTTYITPTNIDASASKFCIKILDSRDFTVGQGLAAEANSRSSKLYLCEVL